MARRIHVIELSAGEIALDEAQAHHVRDVLRLSVGASVELFDDAGAIASGEIASVDPQRVIVRVEHVERARNRGELIVASAIPKGDRADWMIEKLSELGVTRFIPLQTERSVVHPTGSGKRDRWNRIATESAKQSRRAGVMQIDELTKLSEVLTETREGAPFYLSTAPDAVEIGDVLDGTWNRVFLFIGPEGGWTDSEIKAFDEQSLTGVKLTATILRVETAAVAAAAIAATLLVRR